MLLAPSWIEKKCWSVVCWIVNPFPFSKSIGYVSILMPIQGRRNGLLQRAFYQEQESPQALWHPVPRLPNQPYPPAPSPPCPILQTALSPPCVTCPVLFCLIFYYRQYTGHVYCIVRCSLTHNMIFCCQQAIYSKVMPHCQA